jgi:hypothetical protein
MQGVNSIPSNNQGIVMSQEDGNPVLEQVCIKSQKNFIEIILGSGKPTSSG